MNRIDHVVINTGDHVDQALAYFQSMGFTVTPRGYHTLGTINHTIVFKNNYLELLGYPEGKLPEQQQQLVQRPLGLLATVIKTENADQVHATLESRGFELQPVLAFSRPIDLGNGEKPDAKFRVAMPKHNSIPGTVLFYCQHLTPEYIWRSEWQTHANGCTDMIRLIINVSDPKTAIESYRRAIDINQVEDYGTNGSIIRLSDFEIVLINESDKPVGMQKLVFGTNSLEKVETALNQSAISYQKEDGKITADTWSHIKCTLEFECMA